MKEQPVFRAYRMRLVDDFRDQGCAAVVENRDSNDQPVQYIFFIMPRDGDMIFLCIYIILRNVQFCFVIV